MSRKRIVILGGGFGGVYTAQQLERLLRPEEAEIVLVNRENYLVFQPLLPEVVSGGVGLLDTVSPIRRLCGRTRLYVREVEAIDLKAGKVVLAPNLRPRRIDIPYDYLVIASGTITAFGSMPGLTEHALPFRTLGDAVRLRNRALQVLEEADNETDAGFRRRLLTFVVAGGGFSGVEVVAELNDFVRRAARSFQTIRPGEIRCILLHSRDRILPEITPRLADYAQALLQKRKVELKLNARLQSATADQVLLASGESIPARTLVATVPAGLPPLLQELSCPKEGQRLAVNARLELQEYEDRVWALGDCARITMSNGEIAPPTAQHATREARTVAENIRATIRGEAKREFSFAGLGKLGSLGHHSAVAEVFGMRISGLLAWLLWRTIYLMKLPGLDRKLRVAIDWTAALLFPTDLVQLRTQPSDNITSVHYEAGDVIFEQGDVGDCMFVVRSGQVEVVRDGQRIALLGEGEFFGEAALLSGDPRSAAVRAVQASNLLSISKADFKKLLGTFPELSSEIGRVMEARQ
jgi:NADH:quinone reductase (non-electrogenic)